MRVAKRSGMLEARLPAGLTDPLVRAVTENSRTLTSDQPRLRDGTDEASAARVALTRTSA